MNVNSGYHGWSMSNRAVEAYENGERPKSKWTKKAMLAEIASYAADNDIDVPEHVGAYLEKLTKDELFNRFFIKSSWHHTSKFFNTTDFYSLDEGEAEEFFESPTARVYRIRYSLGRHRAKSRRTFPTEKKANKALEDKGFIPLQYSFKRGAFYASVSFETYAI